MEKNSENDAGILGADCGNRGRDRNRCLRHLSRRADSREYESSPQSSSLQCVVACPTVFRDGINSWEYLYYQNIDSSIPSNSGSALTSSLKSWSRRNRDSNDSGPEYQYTLDHPFRSYVTNEFAKQKS